MNMFVILLTIFSIQNLMAMEKTIPIFFNGNHYSVAIKQRIDNDDLLVFIPGLACAKESFDEAFNVDELKKYSLVSIDLPGCGESFKAADFSYSMEDQASIVTKIIEQIPHKRLFLFGHSMGGAIGLLVADKCSKSLRGFVNIEGNLVKEYCHLSRVAANASFENFKESIFKQLKENLKSSSDNALHKWLRWIEKSTPEAFYKSSDSVVKWSDNGELLSKYETLAVPKTYIRGSDSYLKGVSILPNEQCKFINGTHFVMMDNPKEFYQYIGTFIDNIKK